MLNLKSEKVKTIIVILIFLAVWTWDVSFVCKYGETYLDADMASEMVYANKTNEEGVYLAKDWFYGNELRILGQTLLLKPLLLLFPDNWSLVRVISQAILLFVAGLSYIYMTSVLKNVRKSIFFASVLLCPFGFWHMWHDCFDGSYLVWIIFYSFLAGLIFRLSFRRGKKKRLQWIALGVLAFACGLQSIRVFNNLLIPVGIVAFIAMYTGLKKNDGNINLQKTRMLIVTSISCFCAFVGYSINHFVLQNIYTYVNQESRQWQEFSFSEILEVLGCFLQLFGYPYSYGNTMEIPLFSKSGLLCCFGILLIFIFAGGFVICIKEYNKTLLEEQKAIFLTAVMSIIVCVLIFVLFMIERNGSYFLPSMGLYVASLQIATDVYSYAVKKYGEILAMATILLAAVLSGICNQKLFTKYPPRAHVEMVNVVEALEKQGYTQAVSTFWSGNTITELSDGNIEVWVTIGMNLDWINDLFQSKSHLTTRPHDKYAYVYEADLYYKDESGQELLENNDNAYVVYQDDAYVVIGVEE